MKPALRKLTLLTHVTFSVGWLGAVAAYLAVAVAGLQSSDPSFVSGAYLALELMGWYIILPFCVVGLVAGLVQSLGTEWGLFRHYWLAAKFALTLGAGLVLLNHLRTVSRAAALAGDGALTSGENGQLRLQLVVHAALGLGVLLVTTALSVYKPWGRTRHGQRVRSEANPTRVSPGAASKSRQALYWQFGALAVLLLFVVLHFMLRGFSHHCCV